MQLPDGWKVGDPIPVGFAEWLPDLPFYFNKGATVANNVLPDRDSYLPWPSLSAVTATAMSAFCRGAVACFDSDRNTYNYAGDATKLYVQADEDWTDVTNSGGNYSLSSGENWEFAIWGQKVLATCIDENPQSITMGGANFADLTTDLKARHIGVVGQFVVFGNLDESGTLTPNKLRWSGINDETDYTQSASTQSDSQELYTDAPYGGGWIMKVISGADQGLVFQEYAIWRMRYIGSPAIFDIKPIAKGVGTPAKNSVVTIGEDVYFLGQDGFYLLRGNRPTSLSHNKISRAFFDDFDIENAHRMVGAADPKEHKIVWIYPSNDSDGTPDKAIAYDYVNNRFTDADFDSEWIYSALGVGYTLETLDNINSSIDALSASLDSDEYKGGSLQLAAIDTSHQKATFSGTALDGTIETGETELLTGRRSLVDGVRPIVEGDGVTLTTRIKTRDKHNATISTSASSSPESDTNIAHHRVEGRYHRIQVNTSGDFNHAIGCEVFAKPTGKR